MFHSSLERVSQYSFRKINPVSPGDLEAEASGYEGLIPEYPQSFLDFESIFQGQGLTRLLQAALQKGVK